MHDKVSADQQIVKLLLCCLGVGTDETEAVTLKQLSAAEWDRVFHCASGHNIYPIIYKRLEALGSDVDIPDATMQRLQEIYGSSDLSVGTKLASALTT